MYCWDKPDRVRFFPKAEQQAFHWDSVFNADQGWIWEDLYIDVQREGGANFNWWRIILYSNCNATNKINSMNGQEPAPFISTLPLSTIQAARQLICPSVLCTVGPSGILLTKP